MIQMETKLFVADNSGATIVKCIKVLGGSKHMIASIGDVIVVAVQKAIPGGKVKAGEIYNAVIVTTKSPIIRKNGEVLRFDVNFAVLLDKQGNPIGSRIVKTVARELRAKGFMKIISLAPEVL